MKMSSFLSVALFENKNFKSQEFFPDLRIPLEKTKRKRKPKILEYIIRIKLNSYYDNSRLANYSPLVDNNVSFVEFKSSSLQFF